MLEECCYEVFQLVSIMRNKTHFNSLLKIYILEPNNEKHQRQTPHQVHNPLAGVDCRAIALRQAADAVPECDLLAGLQVHNIDAVSGKLEEARCFYQLRSPCGAKPGVCPGISEFVLESDDNPIQSEFHMRACLQFAHVLFNSKVIWAQVAGLHRQINVLGSFPIAAWRFQPPFCRRALSTSGQVSQATLTPGRAMHTSVLLGMEMSVCVCVCVHTKQSGLTLTVTSAVKRSLNKPINIFLAFPKGLCPHKNPNLQARMETVLYTAHAANLPE